MSEPYTFKGIPLGHMLYGVTADFYLCDKHEHIAEAYNMDFCDWITGITCTAFGCKNEGSRYTCYFHMNAPRECDLPLVGLSIEVQPK